MGPKLEHNRNALLQIRIPRELRDEFMRTVKIEDDNASRLVRQWIREYLRERAQTELFKATEL